LSGTPQREWLSFHLFYHGDLDQVLTRFARPAAGTLWAEGRIDSFFFIRYRLGGPHVRLRVRACPGHADGVRQALTRRAEAFLRAWPSPVTLDEAAIRQENQAILAWSPGEQDGSVYPDNSFQAFPPLFETERYGGPELLEASLDFFALSSLQVLRFLDAHGAAPPARRLAQAFSHLARQACGLAETLEDLLEIFTEPLRAFEPLAPLAARGDRAFEERRESFRRLFQAEAEALPGSSEAEAARCLAGEIRAAPPAVRRRIASSQLHMTANRLGLRNTDEIYLARLLERTAADLAGMPAGPRPLRELLASPAPSGPLPILLRREMAAVFPYPTPNELPTCPQPAQPPHGEISHV
jgi:thiopeptide-type bacteriocin biosynthesis protein